MKAGEYSKAHYANLAAIDYYRKLLPIATAEEKFSASIKLGQVLELVGKWNEAGDIYHQALNLARTLGGELGGDLNARRFEAQAETSLGDLYRKQSRYAEAAEWLEKARQVFEELGDAVGMGQVLHFNGTVAAHQGNYALAKEFYEKSLEIRRATGDRPNIASLLSNLGIVARFQGDTDQARSLHEQALAIRRELGDRFAIGVSLNNLGNVAIDQGRFPEARALLEEGLAMRREVGDPWSIANALNNLGNLARAQGETPAARELYYDSLKINQQLDGKLAIAYLLEDIGCLETLCGRPERAFRLVGAATSLRKLIGSPLSPSESKKIEGFLEPIRQKIGSDGWAAAQAEGEQMQMDQAVEYALQN
jgi:tetratricopeptide (TPR) repeat protein